MSVEQHHNLIKVAFGGQTHMRHILTNADVERMTFLENRYPVTQLPVCEGCERVGYWGKDPNGGRICYCKKCGTITYNPITLSEYYQKGYDIDGNIDKSKNEKLIDRYFQLP